MTDFLKREKRRYDDELTTHGEEPRYREDIPSDDLESRRWDSDDPVADSYRDDHAPTYDEMREHMPTARPADAEPASLFLDQDAEDFRARWKNIQTDFVDEPRRSVEQADALVKEVTDRLTSAFTRNRDELERQWSAGDEVSTEDLRRTLQRYRSFFERLLSI